MTFDHEHCGLHGLGAVKKNKAVFNEVAATYKRLALREELLRGDRPRSSQKQSKR
jgi:hypothetical protein